MHGLSDATTDEDAIRRWWDLWPTANIGMVVPPGYVVVDVDIEDAGTVLNNGHALPPTALAKTGRGWHFLLRTDKLIPPKVGVLEHVDLRGPGSYIVAQPSRHISGAEYVWLVAPKEGIAEAPAWVAAAGADKTRTAGSEPGERIPYKTRNDTLTRLAGTMRRPGMSAAAITAALLEENRVRCDPPLDEEEVRRIAQSVARYEPVPDITINMATAPAEDAPPEWRPLSAISDDPPKELLVGMIDQDAPTLIYAAPSVGKGSTGAHIVVESQRLGLRVAIFDAERRPREWSRRVGGLGGDRSSVVYMNPSDLGPRYAGVPIWDAIDRIRQVIHETGSDLLIVDSILPSLNLDERRLSSDPSVPWSYEAALRSLGIPVVSTAHPPKGQPEGEPFGSFAWVAAHRLTWLGVRLPGDQHRVRWRVKKANERGHVAGLLLQFGYGDDGRLDSVLREDDDESTRDWILAALFDGPKTVSQLVEVEAEESGDYLLGDATDRAKARLAKALYRMKSDGWVTKAGKVGKAVVWGLVAARKA